MNIYIRSITLISVVMLIVACTSRAESSFMNRCTAAGNDSARCTCTYEKYKAHYSSEWLEYLGENGWYPADFVQVSAQAIQECHVQ